MRTGPLQVGHPYTALAKVVSCGRFILLPQCTRRSIGEKRSARLYLAFNFTKVFPKQKLAYRQRKRFADSFYIWPDTAKAGVAFSLGVLMSSLEISGGASAMTH